MSAKGVAISYPALIHSFYFQKYNNRYLASKVASVLKLIHVLDKK